MPMKARYTVVDGEVIAEKRNGVRKQYVPDMLGSTTALLDSSQTQTDTFSYWPYGEEASRTGTTDTPFRYVGTGGYYRDTTTRHYVRARYLGIQEGRWVTEDPIGFKGNDWNLYRYVSGNPASVTDREGTQVVPPNHTNYCGFFNVGPGAPVDCIDRACQKHDACVPKLKDCWRFGYCSWVLCQDAKACLYTFFGSGCGANWRCRWVAMQIKTLFCNLLGGDPFAPPGP